MRRLVSSIGRQLRRAREAERFARLLVGGGVALVAGLWLLTLADAWSLPWVGGIALALGGVGGLADGIGSELGGVGPLSGNE